MPNPRTNPCPRCGRDLRKRDQCAHECPHGMPCRYRLRVDGLPVDWSTLECEACDEAPRRTTRQFARVWLPTAKGWEYPLSHEAVERLRRWKADATSAQEESDA